MATRCQIFLSIWPDLEWDMDYIDRCFPDRLGDLKKLITEQEALSEKAETELSELLKKLQEQYETGTKAMGAVEVFKVSLD